MNDKSYVTFKRSSGGCEWFEYSVPGNIHYGYVGRAADFPSQILHLGASVAEITDPAHRQELEVISKNLINLHIPLDGLCIDIFINFAWWSTHLDDPTDYAAIDLGSALYDRSKRNVTESDFQTLLQVYSTRLAHTPAPRTSYYNPEWPYPLGYFDGGQ